MSNVLFTAYAPTTTGTLTFGAAIASKVPVLAKTSNYSVASTDSATVFTNTGATTEVTFTLPATAVGYAYTFYVDSVYGVIVKAPGGSTITAYNAVASSGGTMTSISNGSSITLVAITSTEWIATSVVGAWTAA